MTDPRWSGGPGLPLPEPPLVDEAAGIGLRAWGAPGDADALAAAWADPAVAAGTRVPGDRSPTAAAAWITGELERRRRGLALDLVVVARERGPDPDRTGAGDREPDLPAVLGEVGLANLDGAGRAEIGFWVVAAARGRGVATAAVTLLTGWALDPAAGLGRRQLWARVRPGDPAAGAVLDRAGYVRLGEASGWQIWSRAR